MFGVCVFLLLALSHIVASEKAVICYYGTWATYRYGLGKFDVEDVNPNLCTHLIYTFVGIDNGGSIISLDPYLDLPDNYGRDNFAKFNALKQINPSLKTILAVGGWNEGSAKYSIMAASPTLRNNFIESALEMITLHGFDGLDIDWEYPNRRDTVHGRADIDNFTTLLRELREVFDKHGLLLSAAVSAVRDSASQSYDVPAISQYLDTIHVMAYDMYGAWDSVTGHNSPLHKGEGDEGTIAEDLYTVDQALDYWIGAGCPPEKIALGLPFYGRTYTLLNANVNGVRSPVSGAGIAGPYTAENGLIGYNELCYKFQTESWTKRFDALAQVPYAIQANTWVSYDDTSSLTAKINYANSLGITKIMTWSIETDDFHGNCGGGTNPLLTAINTALRTDDTNISGSTTTESSSTIASTSSISTTTNIPTEGPSTTATDSINTLEPTPTEIPTSTSLGSSPTTESSTSIASSTSAAGTTTIITDSLCNTEGYVPKPGVCSSFYHCVIGASGTYVPLEFICPANLYWDQTVLACNYPEFVTCDS